MEDKGDKIYKVFKTGKLVSGEIFEISLNFDIFHFPRAQFNIVYLIVIIKL